MINRNIAVLVTAAALVACGDDSPAGPPSTAAARIELSVAALELELGDSAMLSATVRDAAGDPVPGQPIAWSTSDADVVEVNPDGLVHAIGAGTAQVTAAAAGRTASLSVTVQPWNVVDDLLVVDSTTLRLLSDSAERAGGVYRFDVLQGAPPALDAGSFLVGVQGGGFLRRVISASTTGSTLTVETVQASLADVVETGAFASTVDLLFDPGSPGPFVTQGTPLRPGVVVWGEGEFSHMVTGMHVAQAGFSLSDIDICQLLKEASGGDVCPTGIKQLKIRSGSLDFSPELEMEAEFEGFALDHFRGVARGSLSVDLTIALEAESELGELKEDVEFFSFTRPFYLQLGTVPVVGYVEMQLTGEVSVKATAKAGFEAGYTATGSVELGAEYSDDSWSPVSSNDGSFDLATPSIADSTLTGSITVEAKVAMKPRLQIIFYGVVGPFAQIEPFGSATLELSTTACGLTGASGINAAIGFTVPFLDDDVADFDQTWDPLITGPGSSWSCPLGTVDVTTTTSGADVDGDGYHVHVDGADEGRIASTGSLSVPFVATGDRTVALTDVAPNCTVAEGASRTVSVTPGATASVSYSITCTSLTGGVEITTSTAGTSPDPDGYTIVIDGASSHVIGSTATVVIDGVAPGEHSFLLDDVAPNCTVSGANPVTASVTSGNTTAISFAVTCTASELTVRTTTTGPPADDTPWTVTLDGADQRTIGTNGSASWSTTAETHTVELHGLPGNCEVSGDNPATVDVAAGEPTEHVFAVSCASGPLTVNVTTETTDSTITSFEVRARDQTKSVAINGSVSFADMPRTSVDVQLIVPESCTVDGINPQAATVPGSVDFNVTCGTPLQCPADPPEASLIELVGVQYPENGSYDAEVYSATWGNVSGYAQTIGGNVDGLYGPAVTVELGWDDWFAVVPIDSSATDTFVVVGVLLTGEISLSGSGEYAEVFTHYLSGVNASGAGYAQVTDQHRFPGESGTFVQQDTAYVAGQVGRWLRFRGYLALNTNGGNGSVSTTSASLRVDRLLGVYDQITGAVVPVRGICTASGAVYPE